MRAFLAAHLDPELLREVAALQDELRSALRSSAGARITWVKPGTIHLTLKFLGDVSDEFAISLRDPIAALVASGLPASISLSVLGAFPRVTAPRALWIAPGPDWDKSGDAHRLAALVSAIDSECARFGIQKEPHAWRPHLTLARIREGERIVGRALADAGVFDRALRLPRLAVPSISLMKSELLPTGPRHTTLWMVS